MRCLRWCLSAALLLILPGTGAAELYTPRYQGEKLIEAYTSYGTNCVDRQVISAQTVPAEGGPILVRTSGAAYQKYRQSVEVWNYYHKSEGRGDSSNWVRATFKGEERYYGEKWINNADRIEVVLPSGYVLNVEAGRDSDSRYLAELGYGFDKSGLIRTKDVLSPRPDAREIILVVGKYTLDAGTYERLEKMLDKAAKEKAANEEKKNQAIEHLKNSSNFDGR